MSDQMDIFEALGEEPPLPTFTVYRGWGGWERTCGWCGSGSAYSGGGACGLPGDRSVSIHYDYCTACAEKYGHPKVWTGGTPLKVVTLA